MQHQCLVHTPDPHNIQTYIVEIPIISLRVRLEEEAGDGGVANMSSCVYDMCICVCISFRRGRRHHPPVPVDPDEGREY